MTSVLLVCVGAYAFEALSTSVSQANQVGDSAVVVGNDFDVNEPICISRLGAWTDNDGHTFNQTVALFRINISVPSSSTRLAHVEIPSGTSAGVVVEGFRYIDLPAPTCVDRGRYGVVSSHLLQDSLLNDRFAGTGLVGDNGGGLIDFLRTGRWDIMHSSHITTLPLSLINFAQFNGSFFGGPSFSYARESTTTTTSPTRSETATTLTSKTMPTPKTAASTSPTASPSAEPKSTTTVMGQSMSVESPSTDLNSQPSVIATADQSVTTESRATTEVDSSLPLDENGEWWWWLLITIGAVLCCVLIVIVLVIARKRREGHETDQPHNDLHSVEHFLEEPNPSTSTSEPPNKPSMSIYASGAMLSKVVDDDDVIYDTAIAASPTYEAMP